jgi:glycosyltransferase involved in cell wall biosynthesis
MRIGIFVVMAGKRAGGPETYEQRLVGALAGGEHGHELRVICLDRQAADSFPSQAQALPKDVLWPAHRVVSMAVSLPLHLIARRFDLLHATFTPPPLSPRPYVFTHHCFSTFNHPEFYDPAILLRLNALLVKGLKSAKLIICVSQNTRDLTAEKFDLPLERMRVVHHGVDPIFQPVPVREARALVAERLGLPSPYVLYLGKIEPRKNILRMLEAFRAFRAQTRDEVKLVMVGRRSLPAAAYDVDAAIERLGLRPHVLELGYVPGTAMLPALYSSASFFAFPSLWEGFGIPVLEAMACGAPVLTSTVSALPEVAGDAARLVDPYSVEDIAEGMHALHGDARLREQLRARGLARAQQFSWERAASETMRAYGEALAA